MAELHVALEEGFAGDDVTVVVNGRTVFEQQGVTTRPEIGLATSFDADAPGGQAEVEVRCRGRSTRVKVGTDQPVWLGLSLDESGVLEHRISATPYGYL